MLSLLWQNTGLAQQGSLQHYSCVLCQNRKPIVQASVHSHALAVSALPTPLNCHPTLTPVSLVVGFSSIALVFVSITPRPLRKENAGFLIIALVPTSITARFMPTKTHELVTYQILITAV